MTENQVFSATCACGQVAIEAVGRPILNVVCYCHSCRTAARQFEQAPQAPSVVTTAGGVEYSLFRKDRATIERGEELLEVHRLTAASPTRRVVATCCNAPMFLEFTHGHWLSFYRDRLGGAAPPADIGIMTKDRPAGAALPDAPPSHPGFPVRFMFKLLASWAVMGFKRPKFAPY